MESQKGVNNHCEGLSDEIFDLLCSPCKVKTRNTEAEKYCVDCNDYYCCTCVKCHEDIPALARHKILDRAEFESSVRQNHPTVPTERCVRHKHRIIDMYCQTHDDIGCVRCMAVDHRECKGIFFIPEFLNENRNVLDCQTVKNDLETTARRLAQHQGDIESNKTQTLKIKDATIQKIKKTRKVVRERIDEIEQNALDDAEVKYKPVLEEINEELRLLQATKSEVLSARNELETTGSNISQEFVVVKKGQRIAKCAEKCIADIHAKDIDIISDQKLLELLHVIEGIGNIGKEISSIAGQKKTSIEKETTHVDEPKHGSIESINEDCKQGTNEECTSVDAYSSWEIEKREINMDKSESGNEVQLEVVKGNTITTGTQDVQKTAAVGLTVTKRVKSMDEQLIQATPSAGSGVIKRATSMVESIREKQGSKAMDITTTRNVDAVKICNVRLQSDTKDCSVTSICPLEDGTFILADYGNKKLKRVDSMANIVVDYCNLPSPPWQVCSVNKQEVAVSYWGNVTDIQFVSIGGKMARTKQMKTYHGCIGVSCGDGKIYISDETTVYVYTMSGTKIKQFPKDHSMRKIFSKISSIAVSADGSKIYVADSDRGLIKLDRNGNALGTYNGSELKGARDTCITSDGGVVVCGYGSNNVLRFGAKLEVTEEVLKPDEAKAKCQAICYNAANAKLIVGREGSDHIEVFL